MITQNNFETTCASLIVENHYGEEATSRSAKLAQYLSRAIINTQIQEKLQKSNRFLLYRLQINLKEIIIIKMVRKVPRESGTNAPCCHGRWQNRNLQIEIQ